MCTAEAVLFRYRQALRVNPKGKLVISKHLGFKDRMVRQRFLGGRWQGCCIPRASQTHKAW